MWTDDDEGSIAEHTALPPSPASTYLIFPSVCLITLFRFFNPSSIYIARNNALQGPHDENGLDPLDRCFSGPWDLPIP